MDCEEDARADAQPAMTATMANQMTRRDTARSSFTVRGRYCGSAAWASSSAIQARTRSVRSGSSISGQVMQ